MRSLIVYTFIYTLSVLILGCTDRGSDVADPVSGQDLGRVTLSFASPPPEIAQVIATISRTGYPTRTLALTISDSTPTASGSFTDVAAGLWRLRVEALDDSGIVRYAGETDVEVRPGQIAQVTLQLLPTSGGIEITVTWGTPSLATGLMAYYPFNGNANDASGRENHGVVSGATLTADRHGHANSAYWFDGIDDHIAVASAPSLNPTNQLTIAFWIRLDSMDDNYLSVIHKGGPVRPQWANREYAVYLKRNLSLFYVQTYSAGNGAGQHQVDSHSFEPHRWLFFAAVIDRQGHRMRSYVNGALNNEVFDSYSTFNANSFALTIGIDAESAPEQSPFFGALDEIRLYNRALTPAEIQDLYSMP